MREYISIPEYFNKELIECKLLNDFLNYAEYINDKKIKMESLRKFYSKDTKEGLKLIDELKMRGFNFVLNSPNTMLHTLENAGKKEVIYTDENNNKISKINKMIFNFLDYTNSVKSDFYFNLIPIYGFENIIKDFNYELAKQEFTRYGYAILDVNEVKGIVTTYENMTDQVSIHTKSENIIKIPKIDFSKDIGLIINDIIRKNPNYKKKILDIKLINILPERVHAEKGIKNKIVKDEIYTLNELINYDIFNLENIRGVGNKSIFEFKDSIINAIQNVNDLDYEELKIEGCEDLSSYINFSIEEDDKLRKIFQNIKLKEILPNRIKTDELILKSLKDDGIKSIYDLSNYNIEKIKKVNGVGVKKFEDTIKKIKEKIESTKSKFKEIEEGTFILEESKYERLKNYSIKDLNSILYRDEIGWDDELRYKLVSQLQGKSFNKFEDYNIKLYISKLFIDLNEITDINKILRKSTPPNISERNKNIIYQRIIVGRTLEEVGKKFDLTRERIRQIVKETLDKYMMSLKRNKFWVSLKLNFGNKEYFYINELKSLINEENYYIIGIILSGSIKDLNYYEPLERVYFKATDQIESDLKYILSEVPDYGEVEEDLGFILDLLSDLFKNISHEEGIKILEKNDIKIKGSYYFRANLNNMMILEIIYKYIHKSNLTLDEEGSRLINKYINEILGMDIERNARNWEGIISRIDEIMLVDVKTYIHMDHIPIEKNILEELKKILDDELSKSSNIYADKLFDKINLEYPNNNIINKHHAYSLVKYYYSEYYQTSTGNSLKISKIGTPQLTNSEYIYDICLENGGRSSLKEIKKRTKWINHRIEMAIVNSDKIIKLGSQKCAILDMLFKNEEEKLFKEILKNDLKEGYTTTNKMYYKLLFDNKMSNFLNRNQIKNGKEIAGLMKAIDDNIAGHLVFMYYKNQNIKDIKDVICNLYPIKVYRNEIGAILEDLKIENWSILYIVEDLLLEKKYVQVSREEYIDYCDFKIGDSIKKDILIYFDRIYEENGFIVPEKHITKIRSIAGYSEYGWNQYTISTILMENRYKKLRRFNSNYKYEIIVLAKEEKDYDDISYLIYDLIKNVYDGNLHEIPIYDFLAKRGIYKREDEDYNKKLQMDAKENNLLTINIIGDIKLKE